MPGDAPVRLGLPHGIRRTHSIPQAEPRTSTIIDSEFDHEDGTGDLDVRVRCPFKGRSN